MNDGTGGGYPDQLEGDEIPIWTQIVSLTDVYDALVSKRCYKDALPADEAMKMIREGQCGVFNLNCWNISAGRNLRCAGFTGKQKKQEERSNG